MPHLACHRQGELVQPRGTADGIAAGAGQGRGRGGTSEGRQASIWAGTDKDPKELVMLVVVGRDGKGDRDEDRWGIEKVKVL